ncbi:hypothetical protein HK099_006301 [Clydaea vesicula]|uniref:PAS domain-containing protein n=1 Tax=Clydaea vesicula TaxID=447962 RepID=A0AAD5XUD0_9FUNG|nr:hypothetical protein HK099_006301 [Clydaea vesicula]
MDEVRLTSGPEGFRRHQATKVKTILDELLLDSEKIEQNINLGENQIFFKAEKAFHHRQSELELLLLQNRQNEEYNELRNFHEQLLQDRRTRKESKKFQRDLNRDVKLKDVKIHDQEAAHKTAKEVKTMLSEHHARIEELICHIEERHSKQLNQLSISQERRVIDQRIMIDLECRNVSEEKKVELMKEFQFEVNHQRTVDKKVMDQLRDIHSMELRHLKERMEHETISMEEIPNLKATQLALYQKTSFKQRREYLSEKDRCESVIEAQKIMQIQSENAMQVKKLALLHRSQTSHWKKLQKIKAQKRLKLWTMVSSSSNHYNGNNTENNSFNGNSNNNTFLENSTNASITRSDSDESINLNNTEEQNIKNGYDREQYEQNEKNIAKIHMELELLSERHEKALSLLEQQQKFALEEKETSIQRSLAELEYNQDLEFKDLKKRQTAELEELADNYKHELALEAQVRGAETKALQERKILNCLLDNVVDGVVSIDPFGTIKRFNNSAEKMFKYKASDVIEKNIKILMTSEYASHHDDYLYNYLSTGVKKIIGSDRQVTGLKSDGTVFPIQLSISELVDDGLHLFTVLVLFSFSFVFVQSIIQRISFCPNSDIKIDSPESATNVENQAASSGALLEAQTLLETENSLLKMMGSKNKNTLDVSFQNEAHLQQCYSFGFWYFCNWAALAMTYYDMPTLTFPVFWLAFGLLGSVVYTILKYFLDEERKVAEDDDLNPTTTKTVIEEHKMLVLKELPWLTQFLISFVFPAFHTFLFFINISMALSPTQIAYFNGIISYVVFGVFVIFCLYGTTPILSRVEKKNVTVATFGLAVIILIIVTLLYPVFNLNEDIAAGNTLQFFQTLDLKSNTLKAEFYGYKGVRNTLINVPSLKEGLCTNEVSGHFFGLGELGEMCTYNLSPEKTINDIAKLNFDEGTQDNEFFHLGNKSILIKNATYTLITESNLTSFEKALNLSISAIKIPDDQFLILPSPNNGHFTRTYISVKLPKNSQICSIRLNSMNLIHSRIPEWPKNEMNEYSNKYKFIPNNLQSRPYLFEIFTNSPTFFLSVHFTCSYFDLKNFAPLFDEVVDHLDNFGSLINYEGLTVTGSYTLHI